MRRINPLPASQRRAFKIDDFCNVYGPARSTVYLWIREGKIRTVKIGGVRLIPADEGERLLAGDIEQPRPDSP